MTSHGQSAIQPRQGSGSPHDDIVYPATIPFALVHLAAFGVLCTGLPSYAIWMAVALYWVRMWALTAGFHRYFSHRAYRTGRVFQFVLAFLCQCSAQRGVLWWAAIHRHHHLYSDTAEDVHSPGQYGLFYAHVGWIFNHHNLRPDYGTVRDLARYPELRWLDRHHLVPAVCLAAACFLTGGWAGLFGGFFLSTVVLYHCAFAINSLAHSVGDQRYLTGDQSRNNWLLALITLGEGWHNNHHHYQSSARQGFRWWEIDPTYYSLRALAWLRVVWDVREPPAAIIRGEKLVGRRVVEKAAAALAAAVPREDARLPTVPELRERAEQMFCQSPALDEIVQRAHEVLEQAVGEGSGRGRRVLPSWGPS